MKILITGANGGFGKLIVTKLLQSGHTVAASMRDINSRNKEIADELNSLGAYPIEIDVTIDDSVKNGVDESINKMNGIDVLINNAGVGTLGLIENYSIDDFRKLYEINVFGVQRMNREVIPHFRKNNTGLIIYVSSLLGRFALPFYGLYQTTKWALEALAENYRAELSVFGIENCIVEPGGFPTSFIDNLVRPSDNSRSAAYGDFANVPEIMIKNYEDNLKNFPQQDPQIVADTIANLIDTPKGEKYFRYPVDKMGMGEHFEKYNGHLEQIEYTIYNNFQMGNLLSLNKKQS